MGSRLDRRDILRSEACGLVKADWGLPGRVHASVCSFEQTFFRSFFLWSFRRAPLRLAQASRMNDCATSNRLFGGL
jgi:hypothetical protein